MRRNIDNLMAQHKKETNLQTMKDTEEKFIVKYYQNYYDIGKFLRKHPGGMNTLKNLQATDITKQFMNAPPHSDAALYLMREYLIKEFPYAAYHYNNNTNNIYSENIIKNYYKLTNNQGDNSNSNEISDDQNMEHLVDWSQAMLPQISKISQHYNDWVHKPVDRPLKLFNAWYLEICTKTFWWLIPIFWLPIIIKIMYNEVSPYVIIGNKYLLFSHIIYFVGGVTFWTFLEYILHRYIFHMPLKETTPPWLCTLHFLLHGLHHKVPFDSKRLVFPPVPGVIIAISIYTPLSVLLPRPRVILAGSLFGYVCYDMMHYYLHYGNPSIGKHLYNMKRYHFQHHFAHQDLGYGISTPIWDLLFNTQIQLRTLKYHLKWRPS